MDLDTLVAPGFSPANALKGRATYRRAGRLFGEFVGSGLPEVSPGIKHEEILEPVPHCTIGEVVKDSRLVLAEAGNTLWEESLSVLAGAWEKPFREVVE